MEKALREAIQKAGGVVALARALRISQQAVSKWPVCPVRRAIAVEKASGVPRERLRPDLYPPR
ncbi:MAG TPA: Cro/CI family transcriptional regulator [Xanthobacteraceae bacterium]